MDKDFTKRYQSAKNAGAVIKAVEAITKPLRISPMMQAQELINKSTAYQNIVDLPYLRMINELMKPAASLKDYKTTIWTAEFIRQMTSFQKLASPIKFRTDFLDMDLSSLGFDQPSSDEMIAFEYDLITEPKLELPETKIILLDEVSRIKGAIREIYRNNDAIYRLEPYEFEQLVAELMRNKHFHVELTKRTRDGGYDLIALQDVGGFPYRFLVECKRFAKTRRVDVNIVRSFCQVMNEEKNNGIIVTSAYFSADAKKYRQKFAPYHLHFKDRDDVLEWVDQYVKK